MFDTFALDSAHKMSSKKRLAIIFDFDDTLADESTSSFLDHIGVDVQDFWRQSDKQIAQGWDPILSYMDLMLRISRAREPGTRITRQQLARWGSQISCRPGLAQFFERAKKNATGYDSAVSIEFFIISSGIGEIIRGFRYRKNFRDIWASDFSYNNAGEICGVKNVVSFTDKTRFIFQIQKGIFGPESRKTPFKVNKKVDDKDCFVPFERMIFVGDGYTDVPCFSLIKKFKGIPIGVYDRQAKDRWGRAWGLLEEQRVSQMVAADFKKGSGLDDAIDLALRNILMTPAFR